LIYVNSPSPVLVFNKNMEKDSNIIAIAKARSRNSVRTLSRRWRNKCRPALAARG